MGCSQRIKTKSCVDGVQTDDQPETYQPKFMNPKKECVEALKEATRVLGESPSVREYNSLNIEPPSSTMKSRFGTWNAAKEAAELETATPTQARPPSYNRDSTGYMRWSHNDGEQREVAVHRLLAVAEFGVEAVANSLVHHKNGVKFDNRSDNIELMSRDDHMAHHHEQGDTSISGLRNQ